MLRWNKKSICLKLIVYCNELQVNIILTNPHYSDWLDSLVVLRSMDCSNPLRNLPSDSVDIRVGWSESELLRLKWRLDPSNGLGCGIFISSNFIERSSTVESVFWLTRCGYCSKAAIIQEKKSDRYYHLWVQLYIIKLIKEILRKF